MFNDVNFQLFENKCLKLIDSENQLSSIVVYDNSTFKWIKSNNITEMNTKSYESFIENQIIEYQPKHKSIVYLSNETILQLFNEGYSFDIIGFVNKIINRYASNRSAKLFIGYHPNDIHHYIKQHKVFAPCPNNSKLNVFCSLFNDNDITLYKCFPNEETTLNSWVLLKGCGFKIGESIDIINDSNDVTSISENSQEVKQHVVDIILQASQVNKQFALYCLKAILIMMKKFSIFINEAKSFRDNTLVDKNDPDIHASADLDSSNPGNYSFDNRTIFSVPVININSKNLDESTDVFSLKSQWNLSEGTPNDDSLSSQQTELRKSNEQNPSTQPTQKRLNFNRDENNPLAETTLIRIKPIENEYNSPIQTTQKRKIYTEDEHNSPIHETQPKEKDAEINESKIQKRSSLSQMIKSTESSIDEQQNHEENPNDSERGNINESAKIINATHFNESLEHEVEMNKKGVLTCGSPAHNPTIAGLKRRGYVDEEKLIVDLKEIEEYGSKETKNEIFKCITKRNEEYSNKIYNHFNMNEHCISHLNTKLNTVHVQLHIRRESNRQEVNSYACDQLTIDIHV
ncbi:hypothetical protein QTN25_010159 [Entamoeba marina]